MMYRFLIKILLDIRMALYGVAVLAILEIITSIGSMDIDASVYADSGNTNSVYNYLKFFAFPLGVLMHSISVYFSESVHIGIYFIYFSVGCWQWFVLVPYLIRILHLKSRPMSRP